MNKKIVILSVILVAVIAGFTGFVLAARSTGVDIFTTTTTTVKYEEKGFDEKIEELYNLPSADSYDKLIILKDEYKSMSDDEKAKIKNYVLIDEALEHCKEPKRVALVGEMRALSSDATAENQKKIYDLIVTYKKILTTEDIESYLSYAVRDSILTDAEKTLKKSLKNPKSYKRKKYEIRDYAYKIDKKGYEIRTDIAYSAKNSYGKTVSNQRTVYCYYKIKDGKIVLSKSNLSTLDKWKMEH